MRQGEVGISSTVTEVLILHTPSQMGLPCDIYILEKHIHIRKVKTLSLSIVISIGKSNCTVSRISICIVSELMYVVSSLGTINGASDCIV